MMGAWGDIVRRLIHSILVAFYRFLGMPSLMKGPIWVLAMTGPRAAGSPERRAGAARTPPWAPYH